MRKNLLQASVDVPKTEVQGKEEYGHYWYPNVTLNMVYDGTALSPSQITPSTRKGLLS